MVVPIGSGGLAERFSLTLEEHVIEAGLEMRLTIKIVWPLFLVKSEFMRNFHEPCEERNSFKIRLSLRCTGFWIISNTSDLDSN